jgi:hypothetical protein
MDKKLGVGQGEASLSVIPRCSAVDHADPTEHLDGTFPCGLDHPPDGEIMTLRTWENARLLLRHGTERSVWTLTRRGVGRTTK